MRVYVVRKWPLWGRIRFCALEYHTSKSVVNVQRAFRAKYAKDPPTRPRWTKATDHCNSEEYRCTHVDACVARTWISHRCLPCHPWCTHRTSLVVQKEFFTCPVSVKNSTKVGPSVYLLKMFLITENITKRPVYRNILTGRPRCVFLLHSAVNTNSLLCMAHETAICCNPQFHRRQKKNLTDLQWTNT